LTKDKRAQEIQNAVAQRDAATLRRMAETADREESRMWLTLLARMVELDAGRRHRRRIKSSRLIVLPPARRAGMRRAV